MTTKTTIGTVKTDCMFSQLEVGSKFISSVRGLWMKISDEPCEVRSERFNAVYMISGRMGLFDDNAQVTPVDVNITFTYAVGNEDV